MDVDGTLISGKKVSLRESVKEWVRELKNEFYVYLVSNNPSRLRIDEVAKELRLRYKHKASKPRRSVVKSVIETIPYTSNEIAIIGDKIFTDILVGNRLGLFSILVKPINSKFKNNIVQIMEKKIAKLIGGY